MADADSVPEMAEKTTVHDGDMFHIVDSEVEPDVDKKITGANLKSQILATALLTAGTDNIKNTHIDWGSGAGQVDADDVPESATKKWAGETGADVTDATNVAAAGAVMEGDTTTVAMSFVIDEDTLASDLDTKVPTQQSVKAYVDAQVGTDITGDIVYWTGSAWAKQTLDGTDDEVQIAAALAA